MTTPIFLDEETGTEMSSSQPKVTGLVRGEVVKARQSESRTCILTALRGYLLTVLPKPNADGHDSVLPLGNLDTLSVQVPWAQGSSWKDVLLWYN